MSISIIQSNNFSTGTLATLLTATASYGSNTTAGSLLLCIIAAEVDWTFPYSDPSPTISAPTTPGFTWTLGATITSDLQVVVGVQTYQSLVAIYYIANASAMLASAVTTCVSNIDLTNPDLNDSNLAFDLIECDGVPASSVIDVTASGKGTVFPISAGNITTGQTDLLLVAADQMDNMTNAGSGYTMLDPTGSDTSAILQMQYMLNVPAATYSTNFGTSGAPSALAWGCVVIAFKGTVSPSVTSVSPNNGPIAGGTAVTITGTDFLSGATVDFGGSAATSVVVVSPTSITCVTPAHAAGSVTVGVTDSDGTGSLANGYTYTNPILDVSPSTLSFGAVLGGANPTSQNVTVSNGDGGTLGVWTVSSDQAWLTDSPSSGTYGGTVAASVDITGLAVGTYTGHLTFTATGATGSPQTVTVTLTIANGGGGGGATNGFTPLYPPTQKQPFTLWGCEAKRTDSITVDGIKSSVLDHVDTVTVLNFPFVALSDMTQWKTFEQYALTGDIFTYRPIPDYPGAPSGGTLATSMFQWPGTVSGETQCSLCQLLNMDWTPKFESPGLFSLAMKVKLVQDL